MPLYHITFRQFVKKMGECAGIFFVGECAGIFFCGGRLILNIKTG